jgi:hypothetical protein
VFKQAMWVRSALAVLALLALHHGTCAGTSWYWCEPTHAYYPWVSTCAESWRAVNPWRASQQPGTALPAPLADTVPPQAAPSAGPAPQPTADQGEKPNFSPQNFPARGDGLDEWCKRVTTALNVALCGDDELRALAIQRLQAFDEATARVSADQRKVLAADQNGWAMSYPQGCALASNVVPVLPLAPAMRECLAQAGRSRLAYLQAFGKPAGSAAASATGTPPPTPIQIPPAAIQPVGQPPPTVGIAPQPPGLHAPTATPPSSPESEDTAPTRKRPPSRWSKLFASPASSLLWESRFSPETLPAAAMTIAGVLIAAIAVGLWVVAALRQIRERRKKSAAGPARPLRPRR